MNYRSIRMVRIANGISQKDFAELVGIPIGTWSNIESGRQPLYEDRKIKAVQTLKDLGCDFSVLQKGTDFPKHTKAIGRNGGEVNNKPIEMPPPGKAWTIPNKDVDEKKVDMVNHPSHYANRKYEVIDVMKDTMTDEGFRGYLEGNAIKYMMRFKKKGNSLEDLQKAKWYLSKLIEQYTTREE